MDRYNAVVRIVHFQYVYLKMNYDSENTYYLIDNTEYKLTD